MLTWMMYKWPYGHQSLLIVDAIIIKSLICDLLPIINYILLKPIYRWGGAGGM